MNDHPILGRSIKSGDVAVGDKVLVCFGTEAYSRKRPAKILEVDRQACRVRYTDTKNEERVVHYANIYLTADKQMPELPAEVTKRTGPDTARRVLAPRSEVPPLALDAAVYRTPSKPPPSPPSPPPPPPPPPPEPMTAEPQEPKATEDEVDAWLAMGTSALSGLDAKIERLAGEMADIDVEISRLQAKRMKCEAEHARSEKRRKLLVALTQED